MYQAYSCVLAMQNCNLDLMELGSLHFRDSDLAATVMTKRLCKNEIEVLVFNCDCEG
jgi:hypothetical protein